jgi:hypothetical protein
LLAIGPHAAAGLSAETVAWIAAIIGAGGSVIGGIVGGLFVLWVGRRQAQQDRAASRADRSHRAAMSIAEDLAALEEAIAVWKAAAEQVTRARVTGSGNVQQPAVLGQAMTQASRRASEMRIAFNTFSRSATVDSFGLTDGDLRARVRAHTRLAGLLCVIAEQGGTVGRRCLIPSVATPTRSSKRSTPTSMANRCPTTGRCQRWKRAWRRS